MSRQLHSTASPTGRRSAAQPHVDCAGQAGSDPAVRGRHRLHAGTAAEHHARTLIAALRESAESAESAECAA